MGRDGYKSFLLLAKAKCCFFFASEGMWMRQSNKGIDPVELASKATCNDEAMDVG